MLGNEVADYKKLKIIKHKLNTEFQNKRWLLKNLLHCGAKVLTNVSENAVAVVANKKSAKFYGVVTCKSPWYCPVCTDKQMAKYAEKIGVAIDALKEQGQRAVMFTFTIPHTSGFTCEQSTEILYNVWKAFTVHGNKVLKASPNDVFSNFMAAFKSKHRVRVCEYTWGRSGWHPHFHCLFWFPAENVDKILEWEERLNKRWLELCKRYTIKQLLLGYPETQRKTVKAQVETRINIMYSRMKTKESNGVYISKSNGKAVVAESSEYICGWGFDKEVTGNYKHKATSENHYSWQQILDNAVKSEMKLNELKPAEGSRKNEVRVGRGKEPDWWQLYFEYAEATRKYRHARVNFSVHSGIARLICAYRNTELYKAVLQRKKQSAINSNGKYKIICWFSSIQWTQINEKNLEPEILRLALLPNAFENIAELLAENQIRPPINPETAGGKIDWIEKQAA